MAVAQFLGNAGAFCIKERTAILVHLCAEPLNFACEAIAESRTVWPANLRYAHKLFAFISSYVKNSKIRTIVVPMVLKNERYGLLLSYRP